MSVIGTLPVTLKETKAKRSFARRVSRHPPHTSRFPCAAQHHPASRISLYLCHPRYGNLLEKRLDAGVYMGVF